MRTKCLFALAGGIAGVIVGACTLSGCASTPKDSGSMGVVNANCPVNPNSRVNESVTTEWEGQRVGFCCAGCKSKWTARTAEEKRSSLAKVTN